jgi:hypothetical protein
MQAADDAVGLARRLITALSLAALALPAPAAMASDIFTVAGTGVPGFAGDGPQRPPTSTIPATWSPPPTGLP